MTLFIFTNFVYSTTYNKLKKHEGRIKNTENKVYINSINILRRNPNAKTDKYEEAMNEIKELDKDLNDK